MRFVSAVVASSLLTSLVFGDAEAADAPEPNLAVSVRATWARPGQVMIEASVVDAAAGDRIAAPKLIIRDGQTGSLSMLQAGSRFEIQAIKARHKKQLLVIVRTMKGDDVEHVDASWIDIAPRGG